MQQCSDQQALDRWQASSSRLSCNWLRHYHSLRLLILVSPGNKTCDTLPLKASTCWAQHRSSPHASAIILCCRRNEDEQSKAGATPSWSKERVTEQYFFAYSNLCKRIRRQRFAVWNSSPWEGSSMRWAVQIFPSFDAHEWAGCMQAVGGGSAQQLDRQPARVTHLHAPADLLSFPPRLTRPRQLNSSIQAHRDPFRTSDALKVRRRLHWPMQSFRILSKLDVGHCQSDVNSTSRHPHSHGGAVGARIDAVPTRQQPRANGEN